MNQNTKTILGIGYRDPSSGPVAIIHGNALQCDHAVSILADCRICRESSQDAPGHALEAEGVFAGRGRP